MSNTNASATPLPNLGRCRYLTATKRRCRSNVLDQGGAYCPRHQDKQHHPGDYSMPLTHLAQDFRTLHGIHDSLRQLYVLLAANRISPRRATTLAYISSLMLRVLRDIGVQPVNKIHVQVQAADTADMRKLADAINSIDTNAPLDEILPQLRRLAEQFPEPSPDPRSNSDQLNLTEEQSESLITQKPN